MKQLRYIFAMLLMALVATGAYAQTQRNRLYLSDITAQLGQIQLPVAIDNTDEIVALQFDLVLPAGMTVSGDIVATNRADGHEASIRNMGGKRYRMLLYSPENKPLRGQTGTVMYIPVTIEDQFDDGQQLTVTLEDAALSLATGEDVLTDMKGATITIAHLPDLLVQDIAIEQTELLPGEHLAVSWKVANTGDVATGGGWTERIALVAGDGTLTKLLATTYYDGVLDAEASVSRQADVLLPAALGIDGTCHVEVSIVTNEDTGESVASQANNTLLSEATVTIDKMLTLTLQPSRAVENETTRVAARLTRSGRWEMGQVFTVTATDDSRINVPTSVTIPASQSAREFFLTLTDNDVLNEDSVVTISVEGNGYVKVEQTLIIEDNELPDLHLSATPAMLTEGESLTLTVSVDKAVNEPLVVTLSSENAKRFTFPQTVTIAAGETSATVEVTAIDDELPGLELSNAFTASASRYNKAEAVVVLKDNDLPVLELTLTPATVSEAAGPVAVAGILRRTTNTNSRITVKLTDDAGDALYFGDRTLVLDKGVEEVHLNFGPVDNTTVDGDRTYTITAAVWLSSCSCGASGESAGYVEAQLKVLDNDGPALSLATAQGTIKEGGKTTLTVSRNTADTSTALTVSISSDYEEGLTYDHTLVIPAGQSSATVEVTSPANDIQGDSHTVVFTVQAEGYATGTCLLMVTDQTLPDARVSSIVADRSEAEAGTLMKITIEVQNDGAAELPANVPVRLHLRGSDDIIGTVYTENAIGIGQSQQLTYTFALRNAVGVHHYYAIVNEDGKTHELTLSNNTSADVAISVTLPFSVTLSVDKAVYQNGDKVNIKGQLTGTDVADIDLELYVVNDGARQVQTVKTDATGAFTYEWQLYALQSGHFDVGVCFPGDNKTDAMTSFNVYGIRRTDNSYVTCDVAEGETFTGTIDVVNPGPLDLTGCQVEMLSVPETCQALLNVPSDIAGGETAAISYSLKGIAQSPEVKWEEIKARITTAEGASLDVTIYFYCRHNTGKLVATTQHIETTITKGQSREYFLEVTNIGKGQSGEITLSLPDFMRSTIGNTIASLAQNDTLTIPLSLVTTGDMELNIPVRGKLGINCANGDGTFVTFTVTPVSSEKGFLVVDVCDEYTYYTDEAPHVKGAQVTIQNPATEAIVYQAETDENGLVRVELPEGRYMVLVTSENHDSYKNTVMVDPESETNIEVSLSISTVKITYTVEPTEIEDQYVISTTMTYETNVPAPVVVVEGPTSIDGDNMQPGESVLVNLIMTNKGLITALNVMFDLSEPSAEWDIRLLDNRGPFDLAPQQSVVLPIMFTKLSDGAASRRRAADPLMAACMAGFTYSHQENCGKVLKTNEAAYRMAIKTCAFAALFQAITGGIGGGGLGGPGGGGGGNYSAESYRDGDFISPVCDPEITKCAEGIIKVLIGTYPGVGPILDAADDGANQGLDAAENGGQMSPENMADVAGNVAKNMNDLKNKMRGKDMGGDLLDGAAKIYGLLDACSGVILKYMRERPALRREQALFFDTFEDAIKIYSRQLELVDSIGLEIFGNEIWYNEYSQDKAELLQHLAESNGGSLFDAESLAARKPASVTTDQFTALLERWNATNPENTIDWLRVKEMVNIAAELDHYTLKMGYQSAADMFTQHLNDTFERLSNSTENVCSSVKLELSQTMTFTRQAFRGTLQVVNASETEQMKNVRLALRVVNKYGDVATEHEFTMTTEKLEGFEGKTELGSEWTLNANSTGTAKILFIPTKYAAPDVPEEWMFGGTLTYIDPYTGLEVTRDLYPVTLTVKPSPVLELTYFMQRDVYGDDPLTLDVVEPMKPAEFALIINNKGNGDATNLRMVTQQPKIVDNEKGLAIEFEFLSSQVNGQPATLAFGQSIANDFGTIVAHQQSYAQWWLQSSLLGHFINYDVKATHLTSYGNPELSLLDGDPTIHELIHGFDLAEGSAASTSAAGRAFLVNDIADADDLPDRLYFTDGTTADVSIAAGAEANRTSATTCTLTIMPSEAGWNYGSVTDPTHGYAELRSIVRQSDGQELGNTRFWQTDRTLLDGQDWLYEKRLHFVDEFASQAGETYLLTFDPTPETLLEVAAIEGLPADGTLATEPVNEITVRFNKTIDPTSFTTDDLALAVQGTKQDVSQIAITTEDNTAFKLHMGTLNEQLPNGYYVLTVATADITDHEGFLGRNGKQAGWIMYRGGLVQLLTSAYPANSGTVSRNTQGDTNGSRSLSPASDDETAAYGSTVVLTAEPAEGYEFSSWSLNGETVSTDPQYTSTALGDMDVVANFVKKKYMVNIASTDEAMGTVSGMGTGIYEHGTNIELTAVPAYDYAFKEWIVDGNISTSPSTLSLTVDKELDVRASFQREYYYQTLRLARGWNWVSGFLQEPLDLTVIANGSNRILSQTNELIRDPQLGMVGSLQSLQSDESYKVQAANSFSCTFRGHLVDVAQNGLSLEKGWNWMGYPSSENQPVSAIANAEDGDRIVAQEGFSEYDGSSWEGTVVSFTPGKGYLYKSATQKTLAFDFTEAPAGSRMAKSQTSNLKSQTSSVDPHQYPSTMNITARIYRDGMELPGSQYTVYAYAGDELRGVSQFVGSNHYLTVYGDEPVVISFIVESAETGETFAAAETLTFVSDVVGSRKSPYAVSISTTTGISQQMTDTPMAIYTLDGILVSRDATIRTLHKLPKGVYIVNGRKTVVK